MGVLKSLQCPKCGWNSNSKTIFQCPSCSVVLEAILDLDSLTRSDLTTIRKRTDHSLWRWFEFFPVRDRSSIVSLGEGYTPLVKSAKLSKELDMSRLYFKNDTLLPSGSLKDRSNTVGLSKAKDFGFETVAIMSTGNGAASVAAYAAVAGLKCVAIVPKGTHPLKIIQARAYGAQVAIINGSFDHEVTNLYSAAIKEFDWYDCCSSNPYRNEGKKSYAYEIFEQLDEHVPHWIIHPTAGGTGLYAIWKGWNELHTLGWVHRLPRLVAAQSEAAAPIAAAFENGSSRIIPIEPRETIANSIQVGNPKAMGWRALEALHKSKGTAAILSDKEILEAQCLLGKLAGIFAEPAAASSLAAARKLRDQSIIGRDDLIICNITGHGLKQPSCTKLSEDSIIPIPPDLEVLRKFLREQS